MMLSPRLCATPRLTDDNAGSFNGTPALAMNIDLNIDSATALGKVDEIVKNENRKRRKLALE